MVLQDIKSGFREKAFDIEQKTDTDVLNTSRLRFLAFLVNYEKNMKSC